MNRTVILAALLLPLSLSGAPSIGSTAVNPQTAAAQIPAAITATAVIADSSLIADSVQLQRVDGNNRVLATIGIMKDDGLNGDARAGDGIFSIRWNLNEALPGTVTLRVSAGFRGMLTRVNSGLMTISITGTAPTKVTLLSPANLSYLNVSPTTVTGAVDAPAAQITVNGVTAPVNAGRFSAAVPLQEGPNVLVATATTATGASTASITVNLDTTPPRPTITSPADKAVTTEAAIPVSGNVNDIVVGTVNPQQVTVTVNGVPAQVANRMFLLPSLPLNLGDNLIAVVARDRAGNSLTTQVTVKREAPAAQPRIRLVSGNNQTGVIGGLLAQPLVVNLTDAAGKPVPNKPVIFKVTQNNGSVSGGATPMPSAIVNTNAQGQAQVRLTLGLRAGAGGNTVEAYSVGYEGTAAFSATGTQGRAGKIVVDSGTNQFGPINQPLPRPFIAVVVDEGNNRLAGVPVTFTVRQGAGSIGTQPSATVTTDSDGRASATLTLGLQEGVDNNLVEANFPLNTGKPAVFAASGQIPGPPANTKITGVVLDNQNKPIQGVTVRAVLTNNLTMNSSIVSAAVAVRTDAQGQFTVSPAPVGYVKLLVDGSTAARTGKYPSLDYDMITVAGKTNTVPNPIFLLALNEANQKCVTPTTGGGTITLPEAPGFSLTFAPGQVTFPGGSKEGCVSVTVVHPDKVPMTPGFGQQPRFIVTIQPAGAVFNPPAPITLPNVDGLKPRAVTEMYSFDHDIGSFVAIGSGTVSDDGRVIRSNAGVGVLKAGWHCGGDPGANGTVADCPACNVCQNLTCVADSGQNGNSCNPFGLPQTSRCQGECRNGSCVPREDPDAVSVTIGTVNASNTPEGMSARISTGEPQAVRINVEVSCLPAGDSVTLRIDSNGGPNGSAFIGNSNNVTATLTRSSTILVYCVRSSNI
ncbi:MAG: Ig-like domain-containing protein [Acidobacteria bacterium]|nr:Ig-like domain-containing protein [Acidobacteriota bacterium]